MPNKQDFIEFESGLFPPKKQTRGAVDVPEPSEKENKKNHLSVDPKRSKTSLRCSPRKLLYQKCYIANITAHLFHLQFNSKLLSHGCQGTRNDSKKKISHFLRTVILESGSWLGSHAVDKASPGYPCKSGLVWAV